MIPIKMSLRCAAAFAAAVLPCMLLTACRPASAAEATPSVERGRYLVTQVGMCADCHTPRGTDGPFDRSRWLMGAPLSFKPIQPMPEFALAAPPLVGHPMDWTPDQLAAYLETGKTPEGKPSRPPMPELRLAPVDARSVALYLESLADGQ